MNSQIKPESLGSFSAQNPPPLLEMPYRPSRPPLTAEERELVKPRLSAHLSQNPFYAQQIAKLGDAFLNSWISGMACSRGLLDLPLPSSTPTDPL
jgi:hypothetical protein